MTEHRFLDISDEGMRLRLKSGRLSLRRRYDSENTEWTVPMNELDAVVLAHQETTASSQALAGLAKAGCGVVVCDEKRMPVGMFLPLTGHSSQAERFRAQAAAPQPLRKRIWQSLVKAKVRHQGLLLRDLYGNDAGLVAMAAQVKSGDSDNLEAKAAQRYWKCLFPSRASPFVRRREAEDENALLNYGYAVLRASTTRALCAAGLHPGLGIFHHNRYDAYCLADDVMEPFRPLVDGVVIAHLRQNGMSGAVDAAFKQTLIFELSSSLRAGRERRTLFDLLGRLSASLALLFLGERTKLDIPYLRSPLLAAMLGKDDDAEGLGESE